MRKGFNMTSNILIALKIMFQGMFGIFISILLIMLVIAIIQRLSHTKE